MKIMRLARLSIVPLQAGILLTAWGGQSWGQPVASG